MRLLTHRPTQYRTTKKTTGDDNIRTTNTKMKTTLLIPLAGLALLIKSGDAFSAVAPSKAVQTPTATDTDASTTSTAAKYDGPAPSKVKTPDNFLSIALEYPEGELPTFDVLAKTIEFATTKDEGKRNEMYAPDYVFRGSIIGPITREDVTNTQEGFQIRDAYPNIDTRPFGFTVDPDNPFRCYFFERWEGKNSGDLKIGGINMKATGNDVKLPTHIMSLHFNREGLVRYACLSSPLDRFEGNTQGAGVSSIGMTANIHHGCALLPRSLTHYSHFTLPYSYASTGSLWFVGRWRSQFWQCQRGRSIFAAAAALDACYWNFRPELVV